MAISQSNTKWFKKGSKLPDGTTAKKSLVWNTKSNKRATGNVKMVVDTAKAKAGAKVKYNAGQTNVKNRPEAAGGGVKPGKPGIGGGKNPKGNAGYKPAVKPTVKPIVDKNKPPKKPISKPVLWGGKQTPPSGSKGGLNGGYQTGAAGGRMPSKPAASSTPTRGETPSYPGMVRGLVRPSTAKIANLTQQLRVLKAQVRDRASRAAATSAQRAQKQAQAQKDAAAIARLEAALRAAK